MTNIKIEALMAMAGIAQEAKLYSESTVLLKKALQYAWKDRNAEVELQIYESIGTNFYLQGDIQTAKYYHMRFMQGKAEHTDSAIKKISAEMLLEFDRNINALEKQNLTTLFLEYINIPVTNPAILPVRGRRTYSNYD